MAKKRILNGCPCCGGYDVDYDPYEEGLHNGMWTPRKGAPIHVSKMREGHLEATKRMCERLAQSARFTSESDKWQAWVDVFENELEHRSRSVTKAEPKPVKAPQPVRGTHGLDDLRLRYALPSTRSRSEKRLGVVLR